MIDVQESINKLHQKGMDFFVGVPDSYLKDLGFCLTCTLPIDKHIIAANEGNAIGIAIGYFLANNKPAVVYMQNSGLGNAINPLTSLADKEIYSIPMLLIIGWRGEPGKKDEPQHIKQGRITQDLLELLEIPFNILDAQSDFEEEVIKLWPLMIKEQRPVALLVKEGTFSSSPPPLL
ncbi:MAG: hypothetical protein LBH38_00945 [Holosporales bacterium]|jgi:phosphonopyruvate decarboxylase|nr:hypothetical protein [Holosporales bacterium]